MCLYKLSIKTERDLNGEFYKTISSRTPLNMLLRETIFLSANQVQGQWQLLKIVEQGWRNINVLAELREILTPHPLVWQFKDRQISFFIGTFLFMDIYDETGFTRIVIETTSTSSAILYLFWPLFI